MSDGASVLTRWLGLGLTAIVCVVTLGLVFTGRIGMYINPDIAWFAATMAVIGLLVIIATFALPLGDEADHGHDHGTVHAHADPGAHAATPSADHDADHSRHHLHLPHLHHTPPDDAATRLGGLRTAAGKHDPYVPLVPGSRRALREAAERAEVAEGSPVVAPSVAAPVAETSGVGVAFPSSEGRPIVAPSGAAPVAETSGVGVAFPSSEAHHHGPADRPRVLSVIGAALGGVVATGVVALMLVLPPQSLSAQAAADRDIGSPPLFGGEDVITLAASGDVTSFGVGEWAAVFATAGNPATYDGVEVSLTGFLTEGEGGARLSRLVVTHCVIDAQPASLVLADDGDIAATLETADTGDWLQVDGTVREQADGSLVVVPTTVTAIDEPTDPYEY